MNTFQIQVYAVLKDYFPDHLVIDVQDSHLSISHLKELLTARAPEVGPILNSCRFAVENKMVADSYTFTTQNVIHIMPPSSGG